MNYGDLDLIIFKHILSSKKNALEFVYDSSEKIFMSDAWRFAKIILDYIKIYKEIPTRKVINERLKYQKNESLVKYVNTVWDDVDKIKIDDKEYRHDLEKIKNRFTERLIVDLKDRLVGDDGRVDIKKSVGELQATVNHIRGVNQIKAYEQKTLKESLEDFRSIYIAKQQNENYYDGFKTGYTFLDNALGSLRESELFLVAAESGVGKSLLMMNMGIQMWLGTNDFDKVKDFSPGADILYFSLEMPFEDMQQRCIACMAKVPQMGIRDATLDEEQKKRVGKVLKFIENYPHDFTIVDMPRGATMASIENIFNDIKETKKKPQIVIVDYLSLLSHDAEQEDLSDWLKLSYISEALHEFARVHNVAVITASQLNRAAPNKSQDNGLHRISRSTLIAANANFVVIIEKRPNEKDLPNMQLHMIKSRRTPLVSGMLYKQLDYCALLDKPAEISNYNNGDISDIIE